VPFARLHSNLNPEKRMSLKVLAALSVLSIASSALAQVNIPATASVNAPLTTAGGHLAGAYWKRPVNTIPTNGASNSTNRIDNQIAGMGTPTGTFQATRFVYLGNDLTPVRVWLTNDLSSYVGPTNDVFNLDDGAFRFSGFINITNARTINLGTTSDDGSRITIAGIDVINNDSGHGDATVDANVVFSAAGLYPIEITFFNGDWTSDGAGANLSHSGNPDPGVHGGANFRLRLGGADITTAGASRLLYASAPSVHIPAKLSVNPPLTTAGGSLNGEYWKRGVNTIATDGASNPNNRIDGQISRFGPPTGTFRATRFVYLGNDLTPVRNWLTNDLSSYVGPTNDAANLDDGAFRFSGFINITNAGTVRLGTTSDDGSRITIGGIDIVNNDSGHGDATVDASVYFSAAGLYPIEITFFNGDWTSDGVGANLNHSGSTDPRVHGGANFRLRLAGADITAAGAARLLYPTAPVVAIPAKLAAGPARAAGGGSLNGEYWKRGVNTIKTDGATVATNRIDTQINGFGRPTGKFQATRFVYRGNDLTPVRTWLTNDFASYIGPTNDATNLDDGAFRFSGFINVAGPGAVRLGTTSDDGSRITIGGIDVINNDSGHGDATVDANVVFSAAGLYPIEITFFNGDWTSDGVGANLNHSGSANPGVHGGANFHLRIAGADVTASQAQMFHSVGPATAGPAELGKVVNGFQDDFTSATRDPDWQAFGPSGDRYDQANGILYISTSVGDPNHLLYTKAGYSNDVQEVLARVRAPVFQDNHDYSRGGLAVGVGTNSQGLNLHFRSSTQDGVPGRQFKLLDDLRAWGPAGLRTNVPPHYTPGWTNNVWYWLRVRLDPLMDKTNTLFAKAWAADGVTAEPANWQLAWRDAAIPKPVRRGFAGLTGSSVDNGGNGLGRLEVDYVLIKADGLPQTRVAFSPTGPAPTTPRFTGIVPAPNNRRQFVWIGAATLEQADNITGPWTAVPTASATGVVTPNTPRKFYRLKP